MHVFQRCRSVACTAAQVLEPENRSTFDKTYAMEFEATLLKELRKRFQSYRDLGEKALIQLKHEHLHKVTGEGDNSIYVIVRHMSGNLQSRFTDFLSSDGEKPWRDRDREFEEQPMADLAETMTVWNLGWDVLFKALNELKPEDLHRTIAIRGEVLTVPDALLRQLSHHAYHVGQIVYLSKSFLSKDWQSLSIPKGQSRDFNEHMLKNRDGNHTSS